MFCTRISCAVAALSVAGIAAWSTAHAQISNPLPTPQVGNLSGIKLVPFAQIPDTPESGAAPRLNMLKEVPDGSGRIFVNDQAGFLYAVEPDGTPTLFLNVREELSGDQALVVIGGQSGFTSFAFHPEFRTNGLFYTVTSAGAGTGTPDFLQPRPIHKGDNKSRALSHLDLVLEWKMEDPSAETFSGTVRELMRIEEPFTDHNVGELAFNPNAKPGDADYGMLYIAIADGGNNWPVLDTDPMDNAQDLMRILGKVIRIDPLGTDSANGQYGIPEDNPFVGQAGALPEIWTYGHRNNHRLSWDTGSSGHLYNFEMGQAMIEEVNILSPGLNYGWEEREGTFIPNQNSDNVLAAVTLAEEPGLYEYPVVQYDHDTVSGLPGNGRGAIAGGFVYRGAAFPELYGKLVFGDFSERSKIFYSDAAVIDTLGRLETAPVYEARLYDENDQEKSLSEILVGSSERTDIRFGMDLDGEIYLTNKHTGWVFRMIAPEVAAPFSMSRDRSLVTEETTSIIFDVETSPGAEWNLDHPAAWAKVEGALSRTGSDTVEVAIEAMSANRRLSQVVVAGMQHEVLQVHSESPLYFFPRASEVETYIYDWAGWLEVSSHPWVYHWTLGWVYLGAVAGATHEEHFWYLPEEGWVYTSPASLPWLYSYEQNDWIKAE